METIRQMISADGLQIPLPLVARYGLHPGARVTLEFDEQGIHIMPALPSQQDIESQALQYLLASLGDAVSIQVIAKENMWQGIVYSVGMAEPLGQLTYSLNGQLQSNQSTTPQVMREKAASAYQSQ